jgi:hypothetical protein
MVALRFPGIPPTLLQGLADLLNSIPNPFSDRSSVEVLSHPSGLVFSLDDGKAGYSFCKNTWGAENDVEVFRNFLQDPIQSLYMPVAYEVAEVSAIDTILANYVGIVGTVVATKIDWISYKPAGKTLLILKLPREAVATLYAKQGGTLTTRVKGTAASLRQIATLRPIVPEEAADDEVIYRAFAIQYGRDAYEQAMAAHASVLREVVAKPNLGISLGPLAVWTP